MKSSSNEQKIVQMSMKQISLNYWLLVGCLVPRAVVQKTIVKMNNSLNGGSSNRIASFIQIQLALEFYFSVYLG